MKMSSVQPKFGISLPNGVCISGVTTWSLELCRRLNARDREAMLLQHPLLSKESFRLEDHPHLPVEMCQGAAWGRNSLTNLQTYGNLAPAIFIPNFFDSTYAICAELSQTIPESIRVIGYCHSFEDCYFDWLTYYEPIIHRFVAVSRECGDRLKELLPHRSDDIIVRPYGTTVPAKLQRDWSPAAEPLNLIYVGRLDEGQKRVSDFPKLAEKLTARGVNFRMQIIGDGSAQKALHEQVAALPQEIQSCIELPGGMTPAEVLPRLKNADACLLVSAYEGTAIAMLEGMAQGCVPVVTKVSGAADVIHDSENGFLVDVGDLEKMADRLAELAADREELETIGRAAHQTATKYSHEEYLDWFVEMADDVWQTTPERVWPKDQRTLMGGNGLVNRTVGAFLSIWEGRYQPDEKSATSTAEPVKESS